MPLAGKLWPASGATGVEGAVASGPLPPSGKPVLASGAFPALGGSVITWTLLAGEVAAAGLLRLEWAGAMAVRLKKNRVAAKPRSSCKNCFPKNAWEKRPCFFCHVFFCLVVPKKNHQGDLDQKKNPPVQPQKFLN